MLAKTYSYGVCGLEAYPVTIEVDVSRGLPMVAIVGLPDNAVKESKERVRAAIKNSGHAFQPDRITINLSPADVKKEGPAFDLAIALGVLAASEQASLAPLEKYILLGELSLDGTLRPVQGALAIAASLPPDRYEGIIVPPANAAEAAVPGKVPVYPLRNLNEVVNFLSCPEKYSAFTLDRTALLDRANRYETDFCDVKGQTAVKRGLEVAAAGGHNALLIGPPGSGKTMLAKRLVTILPEMSFEESLETTKIHSVSGTIPPGTGLMFTRPFRSPHHTSSDVALVGGGSIPKPGEVTLAHNGVLFLDELPEFNRNVLESLRQPLEDHYVTVSRASKTIRFPTRFMLVGAMNPCPCGQYGNPRASCRCGPAQVLKYRAKISGPLLDRIDIHLDVPAVHYQELSSAVPAESSAQIKTRINQARALQLERFRDDGGFSNAQMSHKQVRKYCGLGKPGNELLKTAMAELSLSARAHDKVLKVARTIADLARSPEIGTEHLAEAIQYRSLDRDWWG